MRRILGPFAAVLCIVSVSCGGDDDEQPGVAGSAGSAGAGKGGSAGTTGGSAGASKGGSGGSGGSSTGGGPSGGSGGSGGAAASGALPEGATGLGAKHPGDVGIADFPNMRFRDVATLKIDYLSIGGYISPNQVRRNLLWYDDVVAATSYIGPRS